MTDLGMSFAWSAIQVTLVLVPAAALHALASRRSPASGSWIATLSLAGRGNRSGEFDSDAPTRKRQADAISGR